MITKFSKWILYITSYIPLYIIFIVSSIFDIYDTYKKIKNNKNYNIHLLIKYTIKNIYLIIALTIIIIIFLILLYIILNISSKSSRYEDLYCLRKNNEKINEYILVYILPFITVKTNEYKELTIFMLVFILIGFISVKNDLVYINPILYFKKYNIYFFKASEKALDENILISKYSIPELKSLGGFDNKVHIKASKLANKIYFIKK